LERIIARAAIGAFNSARPHPSQKQDNGRAKGRKMRLAKSIRLMVITIAMLTSVGGSGPAFSQVSIGVSVDFAPPELPVYEQPICPGEGYIWTPGYWAWDDEDGDYYWAPGTWVEAPEVGFLWTPGYWGWGGSAFIFHEGYWGPQVGFYGGINYGYGYFGRGYEGGRWDGRRFYYNRAVNNVNVTVIHNVYETRVTNVNVTRVSYNGPNGGVNVRPTPQEEAAVRERHLPLAPVQQQHIQAARTNRELHASENRGKPPIAATQRPGTFTGGAVVPAKEGGKYNPPPNRGRRNENRATDAPNNNPNRRENDANRPPANNRPENNANRPPNSNRPENNANRPNYVHPNDVPKHERPAVDPNANRKYQQQQDKLAQKQEQEHQKLQQKQEQEHQRATQQKSDEPRKQQMEQRHQQQTQQMEQKHQQQQQKAQQHQQPHQQAPPRQNEQKPPNEKHP
jgi:hypothetical protein